MKLLTLDEEQAAVLLDAARAAHAFLLHRSARRDPDGHVTNAAELQRRKIEQIERQLAQPPIMPFSSLPTEHQENVRRSVQGIIDAQSPEQADYAYAALWAALAATRLAAPRTIHDPEP